MSQIGVSSRPGTQMSGRQSYVPILPEIQHPLSRLGNPDGINVDVRMVTRRGSLEGTGRPMAAEQSYDSPRKIYSSRGRVESRLRTSQNIAQAPVYESIPENVEVTIGDPSKIKMPIFGSKASGESRGNLQSRAESRAASRASRMSRPSTQARIEIDELEASLKDKMKTGFYEIRKRFKDNDPEGKGNVSREALFRIMVTTLNRPLTQNIFNRLMDRIGITDRQVIAFNEFFAIFREVPTKEYPKWMDTVNRHNDKVTMTAHQVHAQLKEKARQRVLDVADIIPQLNPDGARRLLKPEFRNALAKMLYFMDDDEFEKLWKIYDSDNTGVINGEKMMKRLGISLEEQGRISPTSPPPKIGKKPPRKKEVERQRSLDIERFIKNKFRESFFAMKEKFEACDPAKTGMVCHDDFLDVLAESGLKLDKGHCDEFLARCNIELSKKGVPYREFLHRFQDRSEAGMAHTILGDPKHRYNVSRGGTAGAKSTVSALETQLMSMFQNDFLALLGTFHKIDNLGTDMITQEEFRAAIESRFNLEMTDDQFTAFIDRVPLDQHGMVKYAEFMGNFDTRGKAKSLFQGSSALAPKPSLSPREPELALESIENQVDRLVVSHEEMPTVETVKRPPQELFRIIKELFSQRYRQVETEFYEMDEQNSQRLSQEMMYLLLKKFDIKPEVTRGEIRDLWKTFITNVDNKLEWLQFIRHFGYSLKSASFPNAKVSPPKRGDADYMIRSRKLNCAADMLQDNLRSKIDYMWDDLRREFVEMDPYGTGFVTHDEFKDILTELCVHLSNYEQEILVRKFDQGDGRVSYIEFLKPFANKKHHWRHGNNMLSLLTHPNPELPIPDIVEPPQKGLHGITAKLRQKLTGDWKNLRRAFKKLDVNNEGYLSLPEFRSVLKLANVLLDEDEVYHVMTNFDEDLTGKISYHKFLNETFKPETRHSTRMPPKQAV